MHWKRAEYIVKTTEWMLRCSTLHECKSVLGMSLRTLKKVLKRMGRMDLALAIERMGSK